jgi:heme O synthase-like polyprenyltransferase
MDEADKLLSPEFQPVVEQIIGKVAPDRQILLYSVLLYAVSQLPFCAGGLGVPYLIVSLGLGLTLIVMAWQLRRRADRADDSSRRRRRRRRAHAARRPVPVSAARP